MKAIHNDCDKPAMNLVPAFVLRRIERRPNLRKILDNMGWLFFDRALRMGIGLVVGVRVARYLGPEQFGQLNYAIAFVSLFGVIASMGLNKIVVRDIVRDPLGADTTLGTAGVLHLVGGLIAFLLVLVVSRWLHAKDETTQIMIAILGVALIFKFSDVIRFWFESQVQSRYVVWLDSGVVLLSAAAKVAMLVLQAPLIAFVWLMLIEGGLLALGLFGVYIKREGRLTNWSFRMRRAKKLLTGSWSLLFASIAAMIYMRIDQIMLGQMVGKEEVGIYTAALRLSEIWTMVPVIIVASLLPAIIASKKKDVQIYRKRMQTLLNSLALFSITVAIVMSLLAGPIILLLFGAGYAASATVLVIHVWSLVFVAVGQAGLQWYIAENLQHLQMYRLAGGAVANVLLNIALIPSYGAAGAAISTVISYGMANFFLDATSRKTFVIFEMKARAIFLGPFTLLFNRQVAA